MRRLLLPVALLVPLATAGAQIVWSPLNVDEALATAKREQKVLMIALSEDQERISEEFMAEHYKDARLGKLAAASIPLLASYSHHGDKACTRAPNLVCEQHGKVAEGVKGRWLKPDDEGWLITPCHLFIGPDGNVLTSVPYSMTRGELEWTWVDAIRRVNKGFAWEFSPAAHAPLRLYVGRVHEAGAADDMRPPGTKEINEQLARVKKGGYGIPETLGNIATLCRSSDDAVQRHLKNLLANAVLTQEERAGLIHHIGRYGAVVLWDELLPYLAWKDDETVRHEAVVALEQLGQKAACDQLITRFDKETSDKIRGDILRAIGRTAGSSKKAVAFLQDVLTRPKPKNLPDPLRLQAVVALTHVEDRAAVQALLRTALKDPVPVIRHAAVYVTAVRREEALLPEMRAGISNEKDGDVSGAMVNAVGVLNEGRDTRRFAEFLKDKVGDSIARDRH